MDQSNCIGIENQPKSSTYLAINVAEVPLNHQAPDSFVTIVTLLHVCPCPGSAPLPRDYAFFFMKCFLTSLLFFVNSYFD